MMQLGVIAIAVSILLLVVSFVLAVPGWVNLVGIASGVIGLILLKLGRKGDGG